ncbi:MAG: DUF427 domain-containing protein, partial [Pseudomonadota bacterium]
PRPPRLEKSDQRIRILFAGETIAESTGAYRVLETSHPPVYYIPPADIAMDHLKPAPGRSMCEWKGSARYWSIDVNGKLSERAAWSYPDPVFAFVDIGDYLAFYPSKVDECWVGGEKVVPQEGDFYGGWITSKIVGPFKGGAGTMGW